jgi:hypothetical protein
VQSLQEIEARLRMPLPVAETLAASMDAFEAVRALARANEDRVPELFAAFMIVADATIDGRDALLGAPSFPEDHLVALTVVSAPGAEIDEIADRLAALGEVLGERLASAAALARTPGDAPACIEAADAAWRIHDLMACGDDDRPAG